MGGTGGVRDTVKTPAANRRGLEALRDGAKDHASSFALRNTFAFAWNVSTVPASVSVVRIETESFKALTARMMALRTAFTTSALGSGTVSSAMPSSKVRFTCASKGLSVLPRRLIAGSAAAVFKPAASDDRSVAIGAGSTAGVAAVLAAAAVRGLAVMSFSSLCSWLAPAGAAERQQCSGAARRVSSEWPNLAAPITSR